MPKITTRYIEHGLYFEAWINPNNSQVIEAEGVTEIQALKNLSKAIKTKKENYIKEIGRLDSDLKLVQNKIKRS